jgi:hypothetical protein
MTQNLKMVKVNKDYVDDDDDGGGGQCNLGAIDQDAG